MLTLPFFQVFALVMFVFTMSPIILGLSHDAAWSFPWSLAIGAPLGIILYIGKLLLAAIILTFMPIIGRLQTLHTLLLGSFALGAVVNIVGILNPNITAKSIQFWPGSWFIVVLLLISAFLTLVGTLLAALCATLIDLKVKEVLGQLLSLPISAIFGFLPLFIYGAWLGFQLQT
jgi:hypothetical protein